MGNESEWTTLPLKLIYASPFQARKQFDEESLKELARSIEERGLLHAVTVRRIGERYELLAGERRFRAIRDYTEQNTIAAVVITANDREARRIVAIENWLRDDLSAIEEMDLTLAMVDDELAKDDSYRTSENTALERVDKLLSKLDSIDSSKRRGSTISDSSAQLFNNVVEQVEQIFINLPKSMKWLSFFRHDLPLLLEICETIREDAIRYRLKKKQIRALIDLHKASPAAYAQVVNNPLTALKQVVDTSFKTKLRDFPAQAIKDLTDKYRASTSKKSEPSAPPLHYKREFQILKMHRLGIPQKRIAHQIGVNPKTVAKNIEQEEELLSPIRKALRHGKTPEEVEKELSIPLALVWSVKLEGLSEKERFKELGWGLSTWDNLYWSGVDKRFGDDWPGRIPARLVAHVLYAYTKPGDLVLDPMAGGGVVPDVCLLLDRRCWAFDLKNRREHRPEIETHHWTPEALQWPVRSKTKPTLIFFDPPYFSKMSEEYGPQSISALSREQYLNFFREFFTLAHNHVLSGGYMAFLNSDWRDFQGKPAMEEDRSKAITVVNYSNLLMDTGWDNPTIWDSHLPTQRFEPIEVARMQDLHSVGVVRRSLMIAQRQD